MDAGSRVRALCARKSGLVRGINMPVGSPIRTIIALLLMVLLTLPLVTLAKKPDSDKYDGAKKKEEELPLKTAETIEFNTSEGTWMSLDVSPDGTMIVFDLLGDIYTVPVAGGEAKRIVGGMSFESQPKFSPDGKMIAFLSDRGGAENVWIASAEGTNPKALTTGRNQSFCSPSWPADGQYTIASRAEGRIGAFSLWMYDKNGGTGIRIGPAPPPTPAPGANEPRRQEPNKMGAVASPDGRYIYYAQRMGAFSYNVSFPLWQVYRFDRDSSETSTVTYAPGSAMRPLLSPDGKSLVYATRFEEGTGLRVRDLNTGKERWLICPVTRDDQESRATRDTMPGYAFMPDGKSLIVPIDGKIQRVDFQTGKASVIPFTAKVQAEIAPRVYFQHRVDDTPNLRARLIRWPALSPDGKHLAFGSLNKLWILDLPSGTPKRLTTSTTGEFMPTWSPDGRYIAYVTWSSDGGQIFRIPAEGGTPERLTSESGYYADPVYSPDGAKIAFLSGPTDEQLYSDLRAKETDLPESGDLGEEREISGFPGTEGLDLRWIPSAGGDSSLIGPAQGGNHPHFASDSSRIYLSGPMGLVSLRLDGLDRRVLIKVTGTKITQLPERADQFRISPDAGHAFVDLEHRHYVIPIPKAGKETIEISVTPKGPSAVSVKKMSAEGGDYLGWSADAKAVTWSLGSKFYRQDLTA